MIRHISIRALLCALCASLGLALPAAADPADATRPGQVIVKLRSEGPHAVLECADWLSRRGRSFASASADGSDSLDRLHRALGVRRVRALFRRADATPLVQQRARLRARFGSARDLAHVYVLDLPRAIPAERAAAAYARDPHVEYAQPNLRVQADAFVPDDPFFGSSGAWGQSHLDLWGLLIDAPGAWDYTLGEGVPVAVVDTGLDYDHPDIAENVWIHPGEDLNGNGRYDESDLNGIDDDGNGFVDDLRGFDFANSLDADEDGRFDGPQDLSDNDPFDDNGHGTHVSGTIAAVGGNGLGILGVAPRARIMPVKGLGEHGSGSIATLSRGIVYAARNGARVINNSWSCSVKCPRNPVAEDAVLFAEDLGAVVVFSAGNKSSDVAFVSPQNMRETLAVAAHTELDTPTDFSSRGLLVDLTAPGGGDPASGAGLSPGSNILSLRSSARDPADPRIVAEQYLRLAGTSMSAPHVAGVAALVRSARPELSPDEVRRLMRLTADDLGPVGHDPTHGAGRANAARALERGSVPDLRLAISHPRPAALLSQFEARVEVSGTAAGADLRVHELAVGPGLEPETWQTLTGPATAPVDGDTLFDWDIEDLDDGPHVLRLRAETHAGERLEAFAPIAFERNQPTPVSSPGPPAFLHGVSGDLVLWMSRRSGDDADAGDEPRLGLFLSNTADGSEHRIGSGPSDVYEASLSGRRVAWLEFPPPAGTDPDGREIPSPPLAFTCVFHGATGGCPATPLPSPPTFSRSGPLAVGDRVVWSDGRREDDDFDVYSCVVDSRTGRCPEVALVAHPGVQVFPHLDGRHLVWNDDRNGGFFEIFFCALDADAGACLPRRVDVDAVLPVFPQISGDLLAFIDLGQVPVKLMICELDFETGACPAIPAALQDFEAPFDLSGDRLVWHDTVPGPDLDVFFCEYDRATRTCPAQRISGELSAQREPRIDGGRVAWVDERDGPGGIAVFELPAISPVRDRSAVEGSMLVIPVRGRDPTFDSVELSAALADGRPLDAIGARFVERGRFGLFLWRPGFDHAGRHTLRFTAESGGRLRTDETVRIDVRDRNSRHQGGGEGKRPR